MAVLFLTTFFSVLFAILFLLFFLRVRQNGDSCADQDALLPFLDEDSSTEPTSNTRDLNPSNQPNPTHDEQ